MSIDEIRTRLLLDHARLLGKAAVLESLALYVVRGDTELSSALRLKGEELQASLLVHMRWEEARILPLLGQDALGSAEIQNAFLEEHHCQRSRLAKSLLRLRDPASNPTALARHLLGFVRWIERDIASEERSLLEILELGEGTHATLMRSPRLPNRRV